MGTAVTQNFGPGSNVERTQATSAVIDATDRSMPPEINTTVIPSDSNSTGAASINRSLA